MERSWSRLVVAWLPVLIFLLALGVYTATLGPTIDFWDCGEYIATSHILGIPHQPGTPLYVLMGRVFDILLSLVMPTAMAVNFMSGFFSALAIAFVFLTIEKISRIADPVAARRLRRRKVPAEIPGIEVRVIEYTVELLEIDPR